MSKRKKTALYRLYAAWPLLFGITLLTASNGLQGTLLGLRASAEGFPVEMIGFIMAVDFCGYLFACHYVPMLISSVGHIRVFAALASIASTGILLHELFVNPFFWIPFRLITGFCFCGLFIIAESWLNQVSSKKQRGTILSAYIAITNGGLFLGQFLINLAPVTSPYLFILVSIMISFALAPITLTNKPAPRYRKPEVVKFFDMLKKYPLPMAGVFASGICSSTIIGLGPVYANMQGMNNSEVSFFIAIFILGNASLPLIMGALSDRIDRIKVIHLIAFIGMMSAAIIAQTTHYFFLIFILGGMIASLYSVSITYLHDQIKKSQIISASRGLIMFNGIGAMCGPIISGYFLSNFNADIFFYVICFYMLCFMAFAIYRNIAGRHIEHKRSFVQVPAFAAPSIMRLNADAPQNPEPSPNTVLREGMEPPENHGGKSEP
jgi:MFS family permease